MISRVKTVDEKLAASELYASIGKFRSHQVVVMVLAGLMISDDSSRISVQMRNIRAKAYTQLYASLRTGISGIPPVKLGVEAIE